MKKLCICVLVVLMMVSYVLNDVTYGEIEWIEEIYEFEGFDEIYAEEAFTVYVTQGDAYSVKVKMKASMINCVDVRLKDGQLKLGVIDKEKEKIEGKMFVAYVVMPDLIKVSSESAATVDVDMILKDLEVKANAAATIVLKGSGEYVNVEAIAASTIIMNEFEAQTADVICKAASDVQINVAKSITAMARTASDIDVYGTGEVTASSDLTSDVSINNHVLEEDEEITTSEMFVDDYQMTDSLENLNNLWVSRMLEIEEDMTITSEELEEILNDVLDDVQDQLIDWIGQWEF